MLKTLKSARGYNAFDFEHVEQAIDYIYSHYCINKDKVQIRRMSGIGISMGAGLLGLY